VAPVDARGVTSTASRSREAVLAALEGFPSRLSAAARATASRPAPAGEWGAEEVVRHLIACEIDVHQARLGDLDREPSPTWDWAEPGPWPGEPGASLDALLERFATLRSATVRTVAGLDEAGWARSGTHTTLGAFDVRALLANAVDHDEEHLRGLT
jgi:hypothetical protein